MRFSPDGTSIAGGQASVHVNGIVVPTGGTRAGNPQWRDKLRLVCQIEKAGDKGKLYELAAPWSGTPKLLNDKPSSQIVAGGGNWAAWNVKDGYRDSHGKTATWYPIACDDQSGTMAVVTDQQTATGLALWNGATLRAIAAGIVGEACFRGGLLVYRDRGHLKAWSVLTGGPVAIANPAGLAGVQHAGEFLLLGRDNGKSKYDLCLVRKSDATKYALVVSSPHADFYADLRVKSDGVVEVISSPNQGDTLPIQRYTVNPSTVTWQPIGAPPKPEPDMPPDDDGDEMDEARLRKIERAIVDLQDDVRDLQDALPTPGTDPPDPGIPPPSGNAPVIDLKAVKWLHTDVSDWAETSQITDVTNRQGPAADQGTVCFPHTKAGLWPTFDNGTGEGNVLVFGQVNGAWYGACAEWLKPKQVCKRFTAQIGPPSDDNWGIGPHTKKDPLRSWSPKSGEWYGLMVTTRSRDSERSRDARGQEVNERSQIYMTRWP